ncbi:MAG: hypothetical protein H0U92_05460 [Actinobacteria bacterium]|nr:hypothetical protein [Actinomycetota bacterium]
MGPSLLLRLFGVLAFTAAPVAAVDSPTPAIVTGDAVAVPADGGVQNTGGNVVVGEGESSSTVVIGDPAAAPALPTVPAVPAVVAKGAPPAPKPGTDAVAKARALVDAAKTRAEAQIADARAAAERAVEAAQQSAEHAQAQGQSQSDAARANAEASSAHSNP